MYGNKHLWDAQELLAAGSLGGRDTWTWGWKVILAFGA